ncbi:MAG: glycosyltransferase family 2 protein [Myxococcota bacterium]|nr:glycosyltransferase family 2 protein [Myxococcota bacterium]
MSLAIVLPAFNAERQLGQVLDRIAQTALPELLAMIVVDDGSRDGTRALAEARARADSRLELVVRPRNGGYGAAMKDGLERARERGAEHVACVHADGQYSPEALPRLLRLLRDQELDLLQGSRIAGGGALSGGMPLYKYVGNALLNRLENLTLGLGFSDYHSGYLVYGPRALSTLPFRSLSDSFDFDLEVIASARARGLAVAEAPIPTHYGDEVSHLNPLDYGLRVVRVLYNYRRGSYDPI